MSDKARLDYQHAAREEEQAKTSSLHLCEDVPFVESPGILFTLSARFKMS